MKNGLLFLVIILSLISCKKVPDNVFTLQGTITNADQSFLIFSGSDLPKDTIKVNADGVFIFKSVIAEPSVCYLRYGKNGFLSVYFSGGMKLNLTFDGKDLAGSAKFEGGGADKNNYMISKAANDKKLKASDNERFKKDSVTFFSESNDIRDVQIKHLNEFEKVDPKDAFWKLRKADIDYRWANAFSQYPSYYKYYVDATFKVSNGFYNRISGLDINNAELIASGEFVNYVASFIDRKARASLKAMADNETKPSYSLVAFEVAKSEITSDAVRDNYMLGKMKGLISYREAETIEKEIKFFRENCKGEKEKATFEKEFASLQFLAKGQPAIDFAGETADKQIVKLSDLKGKYVYVDVWATWCGPCKYEIPFLLKLEEDYHSRNIVFLSYSIDEDRTAWEKFVPEKGLKGVQLIGEKAGESKLCKDYRISGVPTFMFFDMDGKIISVKMTTPSSPKTRTTFDSMPGL